SVVRDRVRLTAGSKIERTTFSGVELQPSARLAWTPSSQHTFWAAVTRALRTPSRVEDGFRFTGLITPGSPPLYARVIGDGNFESEKLMAYEAGYRRYLTSRGFVGV